jgi:hypothetical protein
MNSKKKKQPAKRVYIKKSSKWTKADTKKAIENIRLLEPLPKSENADMEIKELAQVVSIFGNWNDDQKTRNIRFLASKYWDYLKD